MPILFLSIVPTLLIWTPFYLRLSSFWKIPLPTDGMATIVSNYDGPLYIVVAKTFYNPEIIKDKFSFDLPVEYYAAHFPLYPLLIRLLSLIINYPYSMLLVTACSSILALFFFYQLSKTYLNETKALWLTTIFSLFPARWLIVRSVGSPEPLFIGFLIASIFYFQKKNYFLAGVFGALAQFTKSAGILLFPAYLGTLILPKYKELLINPTEKLTKKVSLKPLYLLLIPLSLLAVFFLYGIKFNDFFAYFHSGDNIHLLFPPFQIFNYSAPWVNTHWLEEIIFIYLFGALGLLKLIKSKNETLSWFVGIFFLVTLFISHRDLMRYSLPVVPFLLLAFSDFLNKKEFKIALILILIPIYLFSLAFISKNVMPISDWSPLL